MPFKLHAPYQPAGDQHDLAAKAIGEAAGEGSEDSLDDGERRERLLANPDFVQAGAEMNVHHNVEKILIPPDSEDPSPRGIAELVLTPVPAAISNAVTNAIGHRFRSLPITPDKVRAVWS